MNSLFKKAQLFRVLFFVAVFTTLNSCKKAPGAGGNSTITGTVWTEDWNSNFTQKNGEYNAVDEWVYIIYGDDKSYSDRIRTNYNGEYEFMYLRKGKYKIYTYSKDNTLQSPSGEMSIVKDVEIKGKKETVTVDRITIYK
jgi:hypothetical protein